MANGITRYIPYLPLVQVKLVFYSQLLKTLIS